ncbi:MAG: flagellar filament capping protein FliD [Pseudomonadota bacterium]|jgi:flagellar hook-associated protein 2
MASISSPGLGSGLDINGIIAKLMQVEAQPLKAMASKEASYQAKLSAFGSLKGALAGLQTAAQTLKNASTFTGMSATSSDSSLFSVSATSAATVGSYDIGVTTLAKANSLRTNVDYGTDTFDSGILRITVGTGTPKDISLTGTNSLSGIRDAVNNANAGVTATIINDGTAERLVLTSNTTGAAGAITVAAPTTNNDGTRRLADLIGGNLTTTQAATDAVLTINGITITRSTNTIDDAIGGVTLKLQKEPAQTLPITPLTAKLTVAQNTGSITTAINAFVKAYNDAMGQIKSMTAYDAANKKASVLTGDSTARSVQSQLSGLLGTSVGGLAGGISRLSDIGISVQTDGTLAFNASKLTTALSDKKDVASLFTQTTSGNQGIAVRFSNLLDGIVGSSGLIASRTDGINASIKDIQRRGEAFQNRLAQIESRYRKQFSALDSLVASMNQTSNYLSQQLANLPGAASNK